MESALLLCGHWVGPNDVVVRVEGDPEDFLICQRCWLPDERNYRAGNATVNRLYGSGKKGLAAPTHPTPCAGCGQLVVRGVNSRMQYVTCCRPCTVRASKVRTGVIVQPTTKACVECGQPATGRADRVYCSLSCRQRAYRRRKRGDDGRGDEEPDQ